MMDGLNNLDLRYNYLNLISEVGQNSTTKATYTWSADGMKLGVREPGANGGGFEYLGSLIYKYVNGQLQLESGSFSNGRIIASHGSSTTYTSNYFITDHLGSTRVVWDGTNAERSDYYPFGGRWASAGTQATNNRFLYNGKELQTTGGVNYLDYGARMYDSRIGRWHSIDPLAEMYYAYSPLNYALNNPINAIDPDGNIVIFINGIFDGKPQNYYWNRLGHVIQTKYKDFNTHYINGSMGGFGNILESLLTNKGSNLSYKNRISAGYTQGKQEAANIIARITGADGQISETIKIVTHSMGAAFGKGYVKALLEYFEKNNIDKNLIEFVLDFAPFQPGSQEIIEGVDFYQYSNQNDMVNKTIFSSSNKKIRGLEDDRYFLGTKKGKGHQPDDFLDQITNLPEGKYRIVDGQLIPY